jgi:RimJ/RimL family protein N-acetyltransferase
VIVAGRGSESDRLIYEPLAASHAAGLCEALTDPLVYAHITGRFPTSVAGLEIAFARSAGGPPAERSSEIWWNFAVRLRSGEFIGRIEATIHDGLAEVAYLLGPKYWGCGYATKALTWLHERLRESEGVNSYWATVHPENGRSIRLLERLGYGEVVRGWPKLFSYDEYDRVFSKEASAEGTGE